jgi:hypothetical protein
MSAKFTGHFSPIVPPSLVGVSRAVVDMGLLVAQAGTTKSRASYNKPTAAVHLVALATGTQWKNKNKKVNC